MAAWRACSRDKTCLLCGDQVEMSLIAQSRHVSQDSGSVSDGRDQWYVITGPPCCGKSTTVELLAQRGFRVRPEIARAYVDEEILKAQDPGNPLRHARVPVRGPAEGACQRRGTSERPTDLL